MGHRTWLGLQIGRAKRENVEIELRTTRRRRGGGRRCFHRRRPFRGRALSEMVERSINAVGFFLLIALMVAVTIRDVVKIF
jgi:membrane-associated protease RseP (regulator of RpoE activity)